MNSIIQEVIAFTILSGAVGYVTYHYWRKQKTKSGCAVCKAMDAVNRPLKSSNLDPGEPKGSPLQKQT